MPKVSVDRALELIRNDVAALLASSPVSLGVADPPNVLGVYMLLVDNKIVYVGEAKGAKGLRDRLLSLTVSQISAPRRCCDWSIATWTSR